MLLKRPSTLFPAILTSKKTLYEIGLLDIHVPSYQEWDTSIRLAKICEFIHIREPLFVYNIHSDETISKNKSKDIEGYWYIVKKFEYDMRKYGYYNKHLKTLIIRSLEFGLLEYALDFLERYERPYLIKKSIYKKVIEDKLLNKKLKKILLVALL
jgi:hypothetical protein